MRMNGLLLRAFISSMMAFVPAASAAAVGAKCITGKPTAASYTWNFQKEADQIFEDIQADAAQAQYHADKLQSFGLDEELSWESHALELSQIRSAINDMGERLCRLETIRRVVAPWQQKTIDRIAVTVRLMADNAEDAIVFGNNNQRALWRPAFQKYTNNLVQEANSLNHSAETAVEYAKTHTQDQQMKRAIETKSSS